MAIADLIAETISQHITQPKVISYAPTKLNEVQGRFVASNRVYNFILNKEGISYSPAGQGDSLLFSALFLRQDAARKPKVGNDKCNAGKSYQCGKICLGNRRKCHKGVRDVNDARRIASILESTNELLKNKVGSEISANAKARGEVLFGARGKRVANPKAKPDDVDALNRLEQLIELGEESKNKPIKQKVKDNKQNLVPIEKLKPDNNYYQLMQKGFAPINTRGYKTKQEALERIKDWNELKDFSSGKDGYIDTEKLALGRGKGSWDVYAKMDETIPIKDFKGLTFDDAQKQAELSTKKILEWENKNGGFMADPDTYTEKQSSELEALKANKKKNERITRLVLAYINRPMDFVEK